MTKLRLRMDIKLYKNNEMVYSTTLLVKERARAFVQERSASEWNIGTCRVWYDVKNDFWNQFQFNNSQEFEELLSIDTELDLVKSLKLATNGI